MKTSDSLLSTHTHLSYFLYNMACGCRGSTKQAFCQQSAQHQEQEITPQTHLSYNSVSAGEMAQQTQVLGAKFDEP